jgi:hypothetical protein
MCSDLVLTHSVKEWEDKMHLVAIHFQRFFFRRLAILLIGCWLILPACGKSPTIDYSDFIMLNGGISYLHSHAQTIGKDAIDQQLTTIKHTLQDNVDDSYQSKDGDAAFLPVGTPVYTLKDYHKDFRLAVKDPWAADNSTYLYYEAVDNPHAKLVSDWLDIDGKASFIEITQPNHIKSGSVTDDKAIRQLIDWLLDSRIGSKQSTGNDFTYGLSIHLVDETIITLAFIPGRNLVADRITVPQSFTDTINTAVHQ